MQRRTVLKVIGGSLVAVAGSATAFLLTRDPASARTPWAAAPAEADPRLFVLRHAILAPNPHNRQPWIIELDGDSTANIFCDLDRRLPETDPLDRQILIGFGCFLELASIAAAEKGLELEIAYFPEGEPGERLDSRPVARITFKPSPAVVKEALFRQIAQRRSVKEPFDMAQPVAGALVSRLSGAAGAISITGSVDPLLVERLRKLTWEAWLTEAEGKATWMESVDLMRIGRSEIEANPDGIDLGGPLFDSLRLTGLMNREALADRSSQAYRSGAEVYREIMASSMGFLWWTSSDNSRKTQLDAGRVFARTHLQATEAGVHLHPVSQCLQEFPAMGPHLNGIHAMLGVDSPGRIQMLARLGYAAAKLQQSPRWPLEAKLKTT